MSDYGITDDGFELKRLDVILEEIHTELSAAYGINTRMIAPSLLDTLITTFANQIAELWETAQYSYYAKFPATAEGKNLDNVLQFAGISREAATPTVYPIHCTGIDGTIVTTDSQIGTNTNPQITLTASAEYTITREACNKALIRVASVGEGTYTISINGTPYSFVATEDDDETSIIEGLKTAITDEAYTTTIDEDGYLLIEDTVLSRSNSIILTDNLTTETVTTIANYDTDDYGKIQLANEVITEIVNDVTGLEEVTNLLDPTYGQEEQTDAEARLSYIKKSALRSNTMIDSIVSELLNNVDDVETAAGFENDTDETDENGLPPHSIEIVVEGGTDSDVAKAILTRKAGGIGTYGSVEIAVPGSYGDNITIRFNRPTYLYAWFKIVLYGSDIPSDYSDLTIEAVVDYGSDLAAGDNLYIQKLMDGIYETVTGVNFIDIKVAYTTDESTIPGDDDYVNQNVKVTQRQKMLIISTRIEVSKADDDL